MRLSCIPLFAALYGCASAPANRPETAPVAISTACSEARTNVLNVLSDQAANTDERLEKAIDHLKHACNIDQKDAGDVVHLLTEDFAGLMGRNISCDAMLSDLDNVPEVCGGIPDVNYLVRRCGQRNDDDVNKYLGAPGTTASYAEEAFKREVPGGSMLATGCSEGSFVLSWIRISKYQYVRDADHQWPTRVYEVILGAQGQMQVDCPRDGSACSTTFPLHDRMKRECSKAQIKTLFKNNPLCRDQQPEQ